jgi:soluble lytic murein transglycosylase-like protein
LSRAGSASARAEIGLEEVYAHMWRRLVAISSFALATGLGLTSLTEPSASLAASAASTDPPSGLADQRLLVEQLQVATRVHREQQTDVAQAVAVAVDADRARRATDAASAARAARAARATRVARPAPPSSGPVDWKAIIRRHPWDVGVAERIVSCESRGNPNARNRSGATGLFQILGGPLDPVANVARAYDMYRARGWQPWSTSRSCWA